MSFRIDTLFKLKKYDIYHNEEIDDREIKKIADVISADKSINLSEYFDFLKCSSKFCWLNFLKIMEKLPEEDRIRGLPTLFVLLQDDNWPTYKKTMEILGTINKQVVISYLNIYLEQAYAEDDEMWIANIKKLEKNLCSGKINGGELMDIKLNRGKIIRKHMGEGLSDLGFVYEKYDGGTWIFEKKLDKFTWYVYIYVYRFDPWQITFHLGTDVSGMVQVHAHQLLDGIWEKGDIGGYWAYHDEDSMIKVLEEMVEVIRNQGIAALKKMSIPPKISTDNEMYHELYLYHKEFAESFEKRTGIVPTGYNEENLSKWFDYIDNRIEELSKGQYDAAAKRELLEMAAFLGEQIVKYKGGNWKQYLFPKRETFCIIYKSTFSKSIISDELINCLGLLVGRCLGNSRKWLEEPFYEVIESAVY